MAVKRIYLRAGDPRVLFYPNQNIACFVYFCLFSNVLDILINNWLMKDWRFVIIQELVNIFLTCELLCWQRNVKETIEVKNKQTIVQDKKIFDMGWKKIDTDTKRILFTPYSKFYQEMGLILTY